MVRGEESVISDELRSRLRVAAALAVAGSACSRKAEPPPDASSVADAGAPTAMLPVIDAGLTLDQLSTFGRDPCPGCGMGGRLPPNHPPQKAECVIGPTDERILRAKPRFVACYDEALFGHPSSGGRVILRLAIDEKGQVKKAEMVESELKGVVNECLLDASRRLRFPPAQSRELLVPLFFHHEHTGLPDAGPGRSGDGGRP
jgi:TonB family protein